MSAPSVADAARATEWVASYRDALTRAARAVGLPPRDLDSAAWLAALEVDAQDSPGIIHAAVYQVTGHSGAHVHLVSIDGMAEQVAADISGGDPLARIVAAEMAAELIAASRWCRDTAREAIGAPRGHIPDPDPRGAKTRQRKRVLERHGQLTFGGWGWQS